MTREGKHLIRAFFLGACLYLLLPAQYGLTAAGVRMLAVFIPTVYLWITCGTGWPSLLTVTVISLLRVADGNLVFSTLWGNSCTVMVIPFYMVAGVLEESGAMEWIVKWVLSRKVIAGRPTLFRVFYCLSIVLVTCFCGAQVSCLIMFRILRQISRSLGYDESSQFYQSHGLLTTWVTQSMDGVRPWGRPYTLTLLGILSGFGYTNATIFTCLWVGIPFGLSVILTACLLVRFWLRPDVSRFTHYDPQLMGRELREKPLTRQGKLSLAGMLAIVAAWLLASMGFLGDVSAYFSSISLAASVCLVAALLCVVTVDGKPVMDLGRALSKVPWNVIVFLGAIMFYAEHIGRPEYGVSLFLKNILSPYMAAISPWGAIVFGIALASLLTNFCSNTVAGVVCISAVVPAMQALPGIPDSMILAYGLGCISICAAAFCTVSACPAMGICYSQIGISYRGTVKYSAVFCVVQCAVMCIVIIPFAANMLSRFFPF